MTNRTSISALTAGARIIHRRSANERIAAMGVNGALDRSSLQERMFERFAAMAGLLGHIDDRRRLKRGLRLQGQLYRAFMIGCLSERHTARVAAMIRRNTVPPVELAGPANQGQAWQAS
jgi:hypothetical protein